MHGNLLAPAKEGQLRAMRRAYERAGWRPQDADLIECHATGTAVGDAVEFESLRELWGESDWEPGCCAIGSVKSTVGHLLTGAGAAAVAKVLLALKAETLPPQANFAEPAAGLRYAKGPFRALSKPEQWVRRDGARRAAVSGFGFGGVNAICCWKSGPGQPGLGGGRSGAWIQMRHLRQSQSSGWRRTSGAGTTRGSSRSTCSMARSRNRRPK